MWIKKAERYEVTPFSLNGLFHVTEMAFVLETSLPLISKAYSSLIRLDWSSQNDLLWVCKTQGNSGAARKMDSKNLSRANT